MLFVGTKKQAQEPVAQEALRAGQPYVTKRWLGGMLTNFTTIKKRIGLLDQLEARQSAGDFERMTKKGSRHPHRGDDEAPGDPRRHPQDEAPRRAPSSSSTRTVRHRGDRGEQAELPVVGTGDTNVDPDELDYIIPANDDAIRSIRCSASSSPTRPSRAPEDAPPGPQRSRSRSRSSRSRVRRGPPTRSSPGSPPARRSFAPDLEDDDLLPVVKPPVQPEATPEEIAAELAREAAEREEALADQSRFADGARTAMIELNGPATRARRTTNRSTEKAWPSQPMR